MKRFATYVAGILALTFFLSSVLPAEENLPLEEFMQRVRNPRVFASYAALDGTVQHQRSGEARRSVPIYFAVVLLPERMTGQIILDNAEGYLLGQTRQGGSSETSVLPMQGNLPDANLLGWMGIHPSDLTMSFLYYPVIRELEPMQERAAQYVAKPALVRDIVEHGCEKARRLAGETMRDVREAMGLGYSWK